MVKYKNMMEKAQCKALIRLVYFYRTVSCEALLVVTRIAPIDRPFSRSVCVDISQKRKNTHSLKQKSTTGLWKFVQKVG